ncbi:AAA family ATPase [Candidatus Peregrinibacteria bacterium]|nr:MAG: AAA family ATPase [Candidatus Peregrinibacteria bacterium]
MIIGLEVRHYKAYRGKNFIPIGKKHNFIAFTGENGVGKSSILEALDTFLNNKNWLLTKKEKAGDSYICPLFLIPKSKAPRLKNYFESISDFFWQLDQKDKNNEFFKIRDSLDSEEIKNEHYLIFLGEDYNKNLEFPFGDKKSKARKDFSQFIKDKGISDFDEKKFLKELKSLYSYVYLPVEINVENFTKIETEEMQKIFDKELKDEIKTALANVNLDNSDGLNKKLDKFVKEIEEILSHEYCYETGMQRNNKVTTSDLVDKILEVYFQKRILNKKTGNINKKVGELSAGEKRQALINLVYAFLRRRNEREKMVIVGIDEPENSLHTSICYEQFEKLKETSKNAQIFITTHWYGFLPIVDKGIVHFLKNEKENIEFFHEADLYLYPYQTKNIPKDLSLKSTNDLVQSIFHSLKAIKPYSWLICEGPSDQIYLEYFLEEEIEQKNLRIIAVGGVEQVKKFYKYLALPIVENIEDATKGKIFCLTDTDSNLRKNDINQEEKIKEILIIKRLVIENGNFTSLIKFETEEKQDPVDIEKSLNPIILRKTLDALEVEEKFLIKDENIQNKVGNTTKENLRNFEIDNYFVNEEIKNNFAKKYIEIMKTEEKPKDFLPSWINEIKEFFK